MKNLPIPDNYINIKKTEKLKKLEKEKKWKKFGEMRLV